MSMNAMFVQVDDAELSSLKADPDSAEALFENDPVPGGNLFALTKAMQERVRATGPQLLENALSTLDPCTRQQMQERLSRVTAAGGGDAILKLMEERMPRGGAASPASHRPVLSLDKAWHGVHYVLCGEVEPRSALLSQAVLGGVELGDDEGFSGYGPTRYFTAARVAELNDALSRPDVEQEAAARFDAGKMATLGIYPGWKSSDADWVMDGFRRLRDFYSDAAGKERAIVTCLV